MRRGPSNTNSNNVYATDLEFILLNDGKKSLSDYAGKVVILDFTGVGCYWCVPQKFILEELYNEYSDADL